MPDKERELFERLVKRTDQWLSKLEDITDKYNKAISRLEDIRKELESSREKERSTKNSWWYQLLSEYRGILSFVLGITAFVCALIILDKFTSSDFRLFDDGRGIEVIKNTNL